MENNITDKKIFFASDVHLGIMPESKRIEREKRFVRWLEEIRHDAKEIYLLGDIFDLWYEFPKVAPKGYVRLLGKLSEICDSGVIVHFFVGNHDGWICDYLAEETGMIIHKKAFESISLFGKDVIVGHGDGLGDDWKYHLLKWFLNSGFTKCILSRLFYPVLSLTICQSVSKHNRLAKGLTIPYMGAEKEEQVIFCNEQLMKHHFDYFIFGHRHIAIDVKLNNDSRYICLGEWVNACTYAVMDSNGNLCIKSYQR